MEERVERVLREIVSIGRKYKVNRILLFGSRAKGTQLERSDIDIAIDCAKDFDKIKEEIGEIETLFTIDVIDLEHCRNELLKEDIAVYGREIWKKI